MLQEKLCFNILWVALGKLVYLFIINLLAQNIMQYLCLQLGQIMLYLVMQFLYYVHLVYHYL